MKKTIILILATAVFYGKATAATPSIHIEPSVIIQGEPFKVTIQGVNLADIVDVRFDTTKIPFFLYENTPIALVGTDLTLPTGNHTVTVSFARGTPLTQTVSPGKRTVDEAPLGIPEKLGGNTAVSQKKLVTSLEKENRILASLSTNKKNLWTEPFIFPLESPTVVDPYGYSRQTGAYTIAHKGTDFKATKGT